MAGHTVYQPSHDVPIQILRGTGRQRESFALARKHIFLNDLEALKWRAMFYYTLERNIGSSFRKQRQKKEEAIREVEQMASWLDQYGSATRIPLWHLLYDHR